MKNGTKKFELIDFNGETKMWRIRALRDITSKNVKAGDLGGYVTGASNLSHEGDCWISGYAAVLGYARVSGNALVCENARVFDDAYVGGNAQVSGEARIFDDASISEDAQVSGDA